MKLELKVKNKKYSGWEDVAIAKSMQSIANNFSMNIFKGDQVEIGDDDLIQILVDDEIFFTGYLDNMNIGISDKKRPLAISGRSKAGDLVDCNILDNKQYNKLDILQIINDLIRPFNMSVSSTLSLDPLEVFVTKIGETYFNAINRLCKQTNTLPISDVNGNLQIVKNENNKTSIVLKDSDFKSLNLVQKLSKRYSQYTYKKEAIVTDVTDATIKDDSVARFRPFVAVNTEDKSNEDLAQWQKNHNKVEDISLDGEVHEWSKIDGNGNKIALRENTIVKLETEIANGSFLIKDIVYSKSDNGTVSNITFVSEDSYNV